MVRKISSIFFYSIAGFFLFGLNFISFMKFPAGKLIVLGVLTALILIFTLIAISISQFKEWQMPTGLMLLISAGFSAFGIFSFICMQLSPAMQVLSPRQNFDMLSDYPTGCSVTLLALGVGYWLIRSANRSSATI